MWNVEIKKQAALGWSKGAKITNWDVFKIKKWLGVKNGRICEFIANHQSFIIRNLNFEIAVIWIAPKIKNISWENETHRQHC